MVDPRAFLSFDFDHDLVPKVLFAGQAKKDSPTPFTLQDWSSKSALPQAEWEALVARKISATNTLIVLVGKSMGTTTGVMKEIVMAVEADVPIFGVYVDGAGNSSTLPTGLQRKSTINWSWPLIGAMVDQAMTLGKNAK